MMGNGRIIRNLSPIILLEDDDCLVPKRTHDLMLPSEVDEIIDGLKKYRDTYSDSYIDKYNEECREETLKELQQTQNNFHKNRPLKGYVYLLSCADKHKIGYSNNVERRIKQLDTRPFPLNLIIRVYSEIAFAVEQKIHNELSEWRVEGEWYNFDFDFSKEEFEEYVHHIEEILTKR